MSWLEDLAAKIEALTDEDFKRQYRIAAKVGYLSQLPPSATVEVPIKPYSAESRRFAAAMGCVNSKPVGPAGVGCVMISGASIDHQGTKLRFLVRRNISWNRYRDGGGRFMTVIDADGQKPYPEIDFSTLPDWPPSTRPG